jgi:ribonuclease J
VTAARVIFLGGVGEIGRNMIAVESDGRVLIIDAGLSFPTDEMLGVDLVLPDFSWLKERADRCTGVVLTHGHEDHVGCLSWLLRDVEVPVYGTPLTLGMARKRLDEFGMNARFVEVDAPSRLEIGPFSCRFLAVSHSIPDSLAIAVETQGVRILYTSDFKLDPSPVDGRHTDLDGFAELGASGVDLMLSDSTNAEEAGRTPSEAIIGPRLDEIVAAAQGRVIVACFASNLHRIQQVCDAAAKAGRRVALVGRSMVGNVEVGRNLGAVRIPEGLLFDVDDIDDYAPEQTVVICTGSQGEPLSALALISSGEHRSVSVERGDTVVLSASPIPGNEAAVHRVVNSFYKVGARVYEGESDGVHVSGHAAADELVELLQTVRPRNLCPVHGEFRHLAKHAELASSVGIPEDRIFLVEDGDVLEVDGGGVRRGDRVRAGIVLVDGLGVGDVGPVVLRDRRVLARDGMVMCVVTIDSRTGEVLAGPDLISRGFVFEEESRDLLDEAADRVADALDELERDRVTDWAVIKKECRQALGQFVWERTRRRPMILPVVMEV